MGLGYSIGGTMTFAFLAAALSGNLLGALLFSPGLLMLLGGVLGNASLVKYLRFDKYLKVLKDRTYAGIDVLSKAVGKSEKWVRKDLKKLIRKGWFKQGHLDDQNTTLITSDGTYRQYIESKQSAEQQRREAEERAAREAKEQETLYAGLTEGQRTMIAQGEAFIKEIHACNDAIPGEEISAKLDRLEDSVRRIMDRARKHPRYVNDLRRLMNYYLPTTVKLLHAYADLDKEEKTTDNILKSKAEIEDTIDTLNDAFDQLFDNMFVDTNLDISTDAEVMKTLLEQEGLTGGGIRDITQPETYTDGVGDFFGAPTSDE
jgi:predicted transcriptional regulator